MEKFLNTKKALNPYLPSWEYVPDAEPHVFGDRVYVYGSHDLFDGYVFCLGDYVCWSAPVNDLSDWRYEGVIFKKSDDPENADGKMVLYAPDVCVGPDGRYYLYYFYDKRNFIGVAVADKPAGPFEYYGHVHDEDGGLIGERYGDEPYFDPAVHVEGRYVFLYGGFCGKGDKSRTGCQVTVLDASDMLTAIEEPAFVMPGWQYGKGTGYEGHEYFEAPSVRKINNKYYLVYSSVNMHELCYAMSDSPDEDFEYCGCIVSNLDKGIDTYKDADAPAAWGANNHGGLVEINGEYYIFYHRHTNGTWYSRQGCAQKVEIGEDGKIAQVEMTSCGLSDSPLIGRGFIPAYIACNLYNDKIGNGILNDFCASVPRITQDGRDGDEQPGYIAGIVDKTTIGFKYFDIENINRVSIVARGYGHGKFEFSHTPKGKPFATIAYESKNFWDEFEVEAKPENGVKAIYITYKGPGYVSLLGFCLGE